MVKPASARHNHSKTTPSTRDYTCANLSLRLEQNIAQAKALTNSEIKNAKMIKTVDQLLDEARALLPYRLSPEETLKEIAAGTLVIDIRGDEQQRQDGLIAGAIVIRRNVLEWRCDPASPWHHHAITHHGQKVVIFCNEGYQSSLAAANLQQLGLRHATDMVGGFSSWKESGLPIAPYVRASLQS